MLSFLAEYIIEIDPLRWNCIATRRKKEEESQSEEEEKNRRKTY
jgi:hypothetical protein